MALKVGTWQFLERNSSKKTLILIFFSFVKDLTKRDTK